MIPTDPISPLLKAFIIMGLIGITTCLGLLGALACFWLQTPEDKNVSEDVRGP